jgi:hypothetical protein
MPRPNQLCGLLVIWRVRVSVLTQDPQDSLLLSPDDLSLAGLLEDTLLDDGDLLVAPLDGLGDPLEGLGPEPNEGSNNSGDQTTAAVDLHEALWTENCYPSAEACRSCHPGQYEQWRAGGHAYAAVSPMFSRFEQAMTDLTRGMVGTFCVRCHSPVGTQLKIPRAASMLDAPPVVREGVTCIACHRVREHCWRSKGDRQIEPGDIHQPVGASGNDAGLLEAIQRTNNFTDRLNLDTDLQVTDNTHFRAFVGPLGNGSQITRWERDQGEIRFRSEADFTPVKGFYEWDLDAMSIAAKNQTSPFELPITIGLVPLLFQNGIGMKDASTGAAISLPSKHRRLLHWSNFDATFFVAVDQINSNAFGQDDHAGQALVTAWFIETYDGYIETGYAYVHDRRDAGQSYHNVTASCTRCFFHRISNRVRVIVNTGQDLPQVDRTTDGVLLLVENSWITASSLTVVPYASFFIGWDRPQSVARAAAWGAILRNTGINFDTDGLSGFATLDLSGSDTACGGIGIDLIGDLLDRQGLLEASYLTPQGTGNPAVPDDQFAVGTRYQFPVSNCALLPLDAMYG